MDTPDVEKRRELDTAERAEEPRPKRRILPLAIVLTLVVLVLSQARHLCGRQSTASRHGTASHRASSLSEGGEPRLRGLRQHAPSVKREDDASADAEAARPVVNCFQVAQPVLLPGGATTSDGHVAKGTAPPAGKSCTVELMRHSFGNSYNQPFVGNYVPPNCDFNRVVMNFTVVSQGRQFDRLALMYMNDTEVWRTSTAEPTSPPGIRWVYLKDMTEYLYFWRSPQKIIFDLGNLINDKYTGPFNTTLTATFFRADVDIGQATPSDLIIPISARKGAQGAVSQFTLPQDNATNTIGFPRNAKRAVFSVSANGQADEEFWWSNVLESDSFTFNQTAGQFPGFSPFREVQVYIDGRLAGVQWPYPVIFTGGVVPGLHRPIAGIDVFDLREHEIDITPWLGVLCDGGQHTFSILVAGLADEGGASTTATLTKSVLSSWYVTGKIFVWLDSDPGSVTTGRPPTVSGEQPSIRVSRVLGRNATGANETLDYTATVSRSLAVSGTVVTGGGRTTAAATWSQSLSYSNTGHISAFGAIQINDMDVRGADAAAGIPGASGAEYRSEYSFPLFCNTTTEVSAQGNLTLRAHLRQGLRLQVTGQAVFPTGLEAFAALGRRFAGGALVDTTVDGTAVFFQTGDGKNSSGSGTTRQTFHFGGLSAAGVMGASPDIQLYNRDVTAANDTVVSDRETISGSSTTSFAVDEPPADGPPATAGLFAQAPNVVGAGTGPRVFMGRGGSDPTTADDIPVMFQVAMGGQ